MSGSHNRKVLEYNRALKEVHHGEEMCFPDCQNGSTTVALCTFSLNLYLLMITLTICKVLNDFTNNYQKAVDQNEVQGLRCIIVRS